MGRYWNAGYFEALHVVKKACDANGITMVQVIWLAVILGIGGWFLTSDF